MNIVVCVKQVIDTEAVIDLDSAGSVIREGQSLVIDPYAEFALEKALQLKESCGGSVVALAVGDQECSALLRHALAMGADEAILVEVDSWFEEDASLCSAQLAEAIAPREFDLIMGGWKSGDTASAQVMARIASILDLPYASMATALEPSGEGLLVTCETDEGLAVIEMQIPAVVSAQQGLAEPRYPNVRDIIQARKKPIGSCLVTSGSDEGPDGMRVALRMLKVPRLGGRIVEGDVADAVKETVDLLQFEAKVI